MTTAKETKMAAPQGENRAAARELMAAFEAFREANDARLHEIEHKASADVLLTEKVDRIDAALGKAQATLERLALAARRAPLGDPAQSAQAEERKAAWRTYVRRGDESGPAGAMTWAARCARSTISTPRSPSSRRARAGSMAFASATRWTGNPARP